MPMGEEEARNLCKDKIKVSRKLEEKGQIIILYQTLQLAMVDSLINL
jgi:hypothetical protein